MNEVLSLLFNAWTKCIIYPVSFPFWTHGLENKFLLQVCLGLFVSSFSIQVFFWRLQVQATVLHIPARCKTPAWMARNFDFRASVSQWIWLHYGYWTVCAHCVFAVAALSPGKFASMQFFGIVVWITGADESHYKKDNCQQDTHTHTHIYIYTRTVRKPSWNLFLRKKKYIYIYIYNLHLLLAET
jgi:hypothetical protein